VVDDAGGMAYVIERALRKERTKNAPARQTLKARAEEGYLSLREYITRPYLYMRIPQTKAICSDGVVGGSELGL